MTMNPKGEVISWSRMFWPKVFLKEARDDKGAYYSSKTTTLEAIGMLLSFLTKPKSLKGKHVVFRIDNVAVVYGWENKQVKNDMSSTIVLRAVHLMAAYLGTYVHFQHIPRCSSSFSTLADHLSRKSTTSIEASDMLNGVPDSRVNSSLMHWLRNPGQDWDLPNKLLNEVINSS